MKKTAVCLVMSFFLLLSACGIFVNEIGVELKDTSWTLVSYGGESLLPGTAMTAAFDQDGVAGSASCNRYFGGYKIRGDKLEVTGLGWTEMACMDPDGIMEQEQQIMRLFGAAASVQVQDQTLIITTGDGKTLLFQELVDPE